MDIEQKTTEDAERVFCPVFSRKLWPKQRKKIQSNVKHMKTSPYAKTRQFLSNFDDLTKIFT